MATILSARIKSDLDPKEPERRLFGRRPEYGNRLNYPHFFLNVHCLESIDETKAKIEDSRRDYNESRPHQALNEMTPAAFAQQARGLENINRLFTAEN